MPRNGSAKTKKETVEICLRMPAELQQRLVALQSQQSERKGRMVSRNSLIVEILQQRVNRMSSS